MPEAQTSEEDLMKDSQDARENKDIRPTRKAQREEDQKKTGEIEDEKEGKDLK